MDVGVEVKWLKSGLELEVSSILDRARGHVIEFEAVGGKEECQSWPGDVEWRFQVLSLAPVQLWEIAVEIL